MTMSLVIATMARESSRMPAAQALAAMTSRSAVRVPRPARSTTGRPRENERIRVCSYTRTPDASAIRLKPRTRRAGCTVAALGSRTPARWTGEPVRRAISPGGSL